MFLREVKKTLFPFGMADRTQFSDRKATDLSEFTEPSPEMRAVVRRHRLGLRSKGLGRPEDYCVRPAEYVAYPIHKRVPPRVGLVSSDALVVTRFFLSSVDEDMSRLLGKAADGWSVLDFDLHGMELAWHNDLMRALEDRAAIWSVSRIVQPPDDVILEHIAMPWRADDGRLIFVGWYHRIGGSLVGDPIWSEVVSVGRRRRSQRISGVLPETPLAGQASPASKRAPAGEIIANDWEKGAL